MVDIHSYKVLDNGGTEYGRLTMSEEHLIDHLQKHRLIFSSGATGYAVGWYDPRSNTGYYVIIDFKERY